MQETTVAADVSSPDDESMRFTEKIPLNLQRRLLDLDGVAITSSITAYEGFGSFHSENVEDLVRKDISAYRPPPLPFFSRRLLGRSELLAVEEAHKNEDGGKKKEMGIWLRGSAQPCEFGLSFRQEHFVITPDFVFLNHGAFGGALCGALAIKHQYEEMMEREVVEFMDRHLLPLMVYSVRQLAGFFNANPQQVVLLQNATCALNCAIHLIEKEDVVAFFDTEYLSVYKMMYFRCKDVGATFHEIPLSKYLHDTVVMGDDVVLTEEICRNLPSGCTTVIFDYITSTTAICLPVFTHLIPALRRAGVTKIIVDGAHAPLQLDLNFNNLPPEAQPSIFTGNLHKWFSSPKSVGFMWVHTTLLDSVHPVVLSHGAGDGFLSEFIWDGTHDYGAYLSIPAVLDFWRAQGLTRVRQHCSDLLEDAAKMLTLRFGTRPVARHAPFMSLVELPEALQLPLVTAKYIQDILHDLYKLEVPVKRVEGRLYVRISAFVYNTPSDYVYLREAVLSVAQKLKFVADGHPRQEGFLPHSVNTSSDEKGIPCDKRIREQGGCGVSGLDPALKRRRTTSF